jgi:hypothetical protein
MGVRVLDTPPDIVRRFTLMSGPRRENSWVAPSKMLGGKSPLESWRDHDPETGAVADRFIGNRVLNSR